MTDSLPGLAAGALDRLVHGHLVTCEERQPKPPYGPTARCVANGLDLADAIFTEPNNTIKFSDVPETGAKVLAGLGLHLGMDVPDWPPDNIEDLAKKYEEQIR